VQNETLGTDGRITAQLGTHTGRRTVVTTLLVDGNEGWRTSPASSAKPATTAGYVKRLDRRPEAVAKRAAAILDGQGDEHAKVRDHLGADGSNRGSDTPASPVAPPNGVKRSAGQRAEAER
jgi:hypothetical protein